MNDLKIAMPQLKESIECSITERIEMTADDHLEWIADMKLVVSFADQSQGHHGGIYQANGWVYTGVSNSADEHDYKGKIWHGRAFRKVFGSHLKYIDKGLKIVRGAEKHRYVKIIDKTALKDIKLNSLTYPKRTNGAKFSDQLKSGGSTPTSALQSKQAKSSINK